MTEHAGIRFRDGEFVPADDPLARWLTVVAMAVNDLVLVNTWLIPSLQDDGSPHVNAYLGRLGASHLYEIARFLDQSERQVPDVREFVRGLPEGARARHERVKAARRAGTDAFASQLEHARNHFFHYGRLLPHAPGYEELQRTMGEHSNSVGEMYDPGTLADFRARFADDIAIEMSLPEKTVNLEEFLAKLSETISDYLDFAQAAINAYVRQRPEEQWEYIPGEG